MKALVALAVLAACSAADRDPRWRAAGHRAPRDGGTLRISTTAALRSLDPALSSDVYTALAAHALFDTLVAFEETAPGSAATGRRLVPALAEHWTVSDDGLVYTFTLRAGVVYSDGTPLVAADARASLERQLRLPGAPFPALLADIDGAGEVAAGTAAHARGLEVPDARTLVIRLAHPNASLLDVLAMTFASPQPEGREPDRRAPLATGPFVLASWDEGQRLVLRKNPRYWDASSIHLGAIEIAENVPADVEMLELERGELDAASYLTPDDVAWIQTQPAWAPYLRRSVQLATFGARMNVRVPPFDDVRVRRAFNYALDKAHVEKLGQGLVILAHGLLPPGMLGRDDAAPAYPYDPARARALLADAGYGSGFDIDYLMPDGEDRRQAASLQADLAAVGVRVHVRVVAFTTWLSELTSARGAPFADASYQADFPDPANAFDTTFHSRAISDEGSLNTAFYATPELDALIDAARAERDDDRRAALYRRADQIVHDDAPWLWSHHFELLEVVQPYVMGYAPHPLWQCDFTHAWLDLDDAGERVPR